MTIRNLITVLGLAAYAIGPMIAIGAEKNTPDTKGRKAEKTTVEFKERKTVVVKGPGDFSHEKGRRGISNFRLREGESQEIKAEAGDRLHKEPSTLPK